MKTFNIHGLVNPISMRRDLHQCLQSFFDRHLPLGSVVYDIGCGQKPFASYLKGKVKVHVGVDLVDGFYKTDQVDLIGSAYEVPAPDGIADAVILSQVIEHLETPLQAIRECHRLLKPGGLMFLSFPFLYPVHVEPRDFLRFTEHYLRQEIASQAFEVVESKQLGGYWYLTGMYAAMYLQDLDRGPLRTLRVVKVVSAMAQLVCLGLHKLEGMLLSAAGKDPERVRARWSVNHVTVLRKTEVTTC